MRDVGICVSVNWWSLVIAASVDLGAGVVAVRAGSVVLGRDARSMGVLVVLDMAVRGPVCAGLVLGEDSCEGTGPVRVCALRLVVGGTLSWG